MSKKFIISVGNWVGQSAVPIHFLNLANELTHRGHLVRIITWGKKSHEVTGLYKNGLEVLTWPSPRPTKLKDAIFLAKQINKQKPDCVIGNFGSVNLLIFISLLFRVQKRLAWYRTLSEAINLDNGNSLQKKIKGFRKKFVYLCASDIIANSNASKFDLIDIYDVKIEKIKVFPNSIDDPIPRFNSKPDKSIFEIVCIGKLSYNKGQDILIQALKVLADKGYQCIARFVGSGDQKENLEALANELELSDKVQFIGHIDHDKVFDHFFQADVTVVPSRKEAFGLVVIESMAVGTPVIGSNTGGIREIISDGVDGYLFEPENERDLAKKIETFFRNRELLQEMGINARNKFVTKYLDEISVKEQADWLENLIQEQV